MWWGKGRPVGRGALLLTLQADSLSLGWLRPASAAEAACWQSVQVPIQAVASQPNTDDALATGAWRRSALREACRAAAGLLGQAGGAGHLQAGPGLVVLAAPPWLNEVVMPWTDALLHDGPAQDHARTELQMQGWTPAADDELRIDLRPGLGQPRSVLQVPGWLTQELHALAQTLALRWHGVQSLVAVAARWAARQPAAAGQPTSPLLGLWSDGLLRLVARDGTPALVGAEWVDDAVPAGQAPDAPVVRVARLWQRACLRYPALQAGGLPPLLSLDAAPSALAAGSGPALAWVRWPGPAASKADLDRALLQEALRQAPRQRAPAASWATMGLRLVVVASLLAAIGLGWQTLQYRQAARQLHWSAAPAPVLAVEPPGKAEVAELRAVNAAVGRINLDLLPLLRALQPPPDIHVSLLGLDLAGSTAEGAEAESPRGASAAPVKLDVEAVAASAMTRYLAFLGSRPGLVGVQLLRHERDTAPTVTGYRFHVEMSWQP